MSDLGGPNRNLVQHIWSSSRSWNEINDAIEIIKIQMVQESQRRDVDQEERAAKREKREREREERREEDWLRREREVEERSDRREEEKRRHSEPISHLLS